LLQPAAGEVADGARRRLVEFLGQGRPRAAADGRVREAAHAILLMPEYQLS
jgi:hypothetical protein